ncbi:MAG: UDP-N-acetylglucosamine 2-epimerase (non-hydrolyzing) [Gemmatimonadota bacterium]|nr:UDP-N-acetylglucosamine 2-epimerase (non-hydrolyzing) [Gemmatimonadota bacterium]
MRTTAGSARIACVFGTRPEVIKMAPVVHALRAVAEDVEARICLTGQHREMVQPLLELFDLVPDADLALMRPNQSLGDLTARAVTAVDAWLSKERPDLVLVQGDTTTAFCTALAAYYRGVPVAHVEAGLRTGNIRSPFPEEANRAMISRIASLHFAPTDGNRDTLLGEGVAPDAVVVTGNTVVDALQQTVARLRQGTVQLPAETRRLLDELGHRRVVVITGHRRENFGARLESICGAVRELAACHPTVEFVFPVHLNPNVRAPVTRILGAGDNRPANLRLIEPLSYLSFVALMERAYLLLTDSGGIQEEGPALGRPVLVMRDYTERPEGVAAGCVRLVGTWADRIIEETTRLLDDPAAYAGMAAAVSPYGDGRAGGRIAQACLAFLNGVSQTTVRA